MWHLLLSRSKKQNLDFTEYTLKHKVTKKQQIFYNYPDI